MKKITFAIAAIFAALALTLTACSSSSNNDSLGSKTLNIYGAASLKGVFTELEKDFTAANPGTSVSFNFAGSSDLVSQITEGAPATVFASADEKNMDKLKDADRVQGVPINFAKNTLIIVTPKDNPANVQSLQDLTKSDVKLVTCAVPVPCGNATATLQKNANLTFKPISEEQSVTDVLNKVTHGNADAGLVYVTDAKSAGDEVQTIEIPANVNVTNAYPITLVKDSADQDLGQKWINLVISDKGQQVLREAGFQAP